MISASKISRQTSHNDTSDRTERGRTTTNVTRGRAARFAGHVAELGPPGRTRPRVEPGPTTEELAAIKKLRIREVADQQRTIEILKAATSLFVQEAHPRSR